jgi:hypothetical protein
MLEDCRYSNGWFPLAACSRMAEMFDRGKLVESSVYDATLDRPFRFHRRR